MYDYDVHKAFCKTLLWSKCPDVQDCYFVTNCTQLPIIKALYSFTFSLYVIGCRKSEKKYVLPWHKGK